MVLPDFLPMGKILFLNIEHSLVHMHYESRRRGLNSVYKEIKV